MQDIVSVLIPTHDRPHLLHRALESLLAQEYRQWECLIIVNGRSDLWSEYAQCIENFRNKTNNKVHTYYILQSGLAIALNKSISHIVGNYVSILEDDDTWSPIFLKELVHALVIHREIDLVYCDQIEINTNGTKVNLTGAPHFNNQSRDYLKGGNWISFPAVVFRKKCINTLRQFDTEVGVATDWDTWLRLSKYHRFLHVRLPLLTHYWHDNNYCRTEDGDKAQEIMARRLRKGYYD